MKMRWFLAGLAALLITGGGATVAQRVITQKTRGVLPEKDESAHPDSRPASMPVALVREPLPAITPPQPALTSIAPDGMPTAESDLPSPAAPEPQPVIATTAVAAVLELPAEEPPATIGDPASPPQQADPSVSPTDVTAAPDHASPLPSVADPGAAVSAPPTEPLTSKPDPVASVETFVERNRKEAEGAIESLTTEAANLRERLVKVETALARWQSFSRALNMDQSASQPDLAPAQKPNWKRSAPEPAGRPVDSAPLAEPARLHELSAPPVIETIPETPKSEPSANPPLPLPIDVPEAKPNTPEPMPKPTPEPPATPPVEPPPSSPDRY